MPNGSKVREITTPGCGAKRRGKAEGRRAKRVERVGVGPHAH